MSSQVGRPPEDVGDDLGRSATTEIAPAVDFPPAIDLSPAVNLPAPIDLAASVDLAAPVDLASAFVQSALFELLWRELSSRLTIHDPLL